MIFKVEIVYGGLDGYRLGTEVDLEEMERMLDLLCNRVLKMSQEEINFFELEKFIEDAKEFDIDESKATQMSKQRQFNMVIRRLA